MSNVYKIIKGSAAEQFANSRIKIRLYGGGFANGKTTALVIDALKVAKDYPGAVMMLGRATFPKLNTTLRREFFKWCPPSWIAGAAITPINYCELINKTMIDFRYIDQRTSAQGESTSNVLSANYDYIGVDQIEDPEITEEDFQQLLGRLRGSAEYKGNEPTMPSTGPRQIALTCNPNLGWVYKQLVKPLHDFRRGINNPDLLCEVDEFGNRVLVDGKPIPIIEVFEASTYDNAQNLPADYIKTLEATYRGKMRDRYLLGKWVAFEGVVYEDFDEAVHVIAQSTMLKHIESLRQEGQRLTVIEGYDFGATSPSCYMIALVDLYGNIYIVDGFYKPSASAENTGIAWQAEEITKLRTIHAYEELQALDNDPEIYADPSIFKMNNVTSLRGVSIAQMFNELGIKMRRGNNERLNGVIKVSQYLQVQETRLNPFTTAYGSPRLFVADHLNWFKDEIVTWRWHKDRAGNPVDKMVDSNDHAMDTLRYMLTDAPKPAVSIRKKRKVLPKSITVWQEFDRQDPDSRLRRHN